MFSIPYKCVEFGCIIIEAKNKEEAIELFENGKGDYIDEDRQNEYYPEKIKVVKKMIDYVKIPVYYTIIDGKRVYDKESMQEEFERNVEDLKEPEPEDKKFVICVVSYHQVRYTIRAKTLEEAKDKYENGDFDFEDGEEGGAMHGEVVNEEWEEVK